ncbi:MAG: hypothetical protein WCY16_10135 [Weeksellaceae bacterium]
MEKEELLSIRSYAKLRGVSHVAVKKAIDTGKIVKGYDLKKKKVIPSIADQEYGFEVSIKKINEKIKAQIFQKDLDAYSGVDVIEIQIQPDDTAPEADRKGKIIKAQLDLLKLKTQSKELINKEESYKEMFAYGKEIRMSLQAIPDRIIDELISLPRNEAHRLLSECINESLLKLTSNAD